MRIEVQKNDYDNEIIVGKVTYNQDLDYWDGRNYSCGSCGYHNGLARLKRPYKDGRLFVLIVGTDYQGEKDWASLKTDKEILNIIVKSNNLEILEKKGYKRLKDLYKKNNLKK